MMHESRNHDSKDHMLHVQNQYLALDLRNIMSCFSNRNPRFLVNLYGTYILKVSLSKSQTSQTGEALHGFSN